MTQLTDKEKDTLKGLEKYICEEGVSNAFLVELFKLAGSYLNLQTISDYAREHNMSYEGVKKHRNIVKLFNIKFVIDND